MSGQRDTHFLRFANFVRLEIQKELTIHALTNPATISQKITEIIARRAYDLVAHTIENTIHIDLDRLSTDEHVLRIPDLTELPLEPPLQG